MDFLKKLLGDKGKNLTRLAVTAGALLPFKAGIPIAGSVEALRQLFAEQQMSPSEGLSNVIQASGEAAAGAGIGKVLGKGLSFLGNPVRALAGIGGDILAKSPVGVPLSALTDIITQRIPKVMTPFLTGDVPARQQASRLAAGLTSGQFGDIESLIPTSDIGERILPMSAIDTIRKAIGQKAYETAMPAEKQAAFREMYRILREQVSGASPIAGKLLTAEGALKNFATKFGQTAIHTGETVGPFRFWGLPNIAANVLRGTVLNRYAPAALAGLVTPNVIESTVNKPMPKGGITYTNQEGQQTNQPDQRAQSPKLYFSQQLGKNSDDISDDGQWIWNQQANKWEPNMVYPQSPYYQAIQLTGSNLPSQEDFQRALLQDLQTTGGKNTDVIKRTADYFETVRKSHQLSSQVQDRTAGLETARGIIKDSATYHKLAYGPLGALYQLKSFAGFKIPGEAVDLQSNYDNLKWNIARAFNGSRISDKDFRLMQSLVPSIRDNPENAGRKLQQLEKRLKENEHFIQSFTFQGQENQQVAPIEQPTSSINQPLASGGLNIAAPSMSEGSISGQVIPGNANNLSNLTSQLPQAQPYTGLISQSAQQQNIPPEILMALLQQESGFNPNAQSPAGAQGIAQFMPATAQSYGINPYLPQQAIPAAAQYLGNAMGQFHSIPLALAAYNAGSGAVQQYGGIPPYTETHNYVQAILNLARQLGYKG